MDYLLTMPIPHIRSLLAKLPFGADRLVSPAVAVLRLSGVIAPSASSPLRGGTLSLAGMAPSIERAFALPNLKAVALAVNSPGGSPVQSALLAGRIRALAREKAVPVIAFAEDVAASGGYWLALAADEIFADPNSLLGSVGVISAGFGFTELLSRYGVERRLHTQGTRKSLLDPFRPERPEDVARLERLQREIHESFIAEVRERRGTRLVQPEENGVFEGEIFTGRRALELGLIDGLGDLRTVLRQRFGEKLRLVPVAPAAGWLRRRLRLAGADRGLGDIAATLAEGLEARALWARYGL